jgi:CysZ protein
MPDTWLLGMLPGLLAALVATAVLAALLLWVDDLAVLLTPFADGWQPGQRRLLRTAVGALLVVGYLVLVVFTFAAVANTIGQPFFEQISDRVERRLGNAPSGTGKPWWRTLPGATADSIRLLGLTASFGVPLFVLGLVPVIGQTVVPVTGALVGGFFLAGELLAIPLERRGLRLPARLRLLRQHLPLSVGFGVACFLLFLVPVMNLVAMPGAIVGGTLLTRRLLPAPRPGPDDQPEGEVPAARAHPQPQHPPGHPEERGDAST